MSNPSTDRPDWPEQVLAWETSGVPQKEYCRQKELRYQRFVYERSQLMKKRQNSQAGQFLPIKKEAKLSSMEASPSSLTALPTGFVLRCPSGYQLAIPGEADAMTLNRLLSFIGAIAC
jgi:hypothetical protein